MYNNNSSNQQIDPRLVRIGIIAAIVIIIGGVLAFLIGVVLRKNPYGDEIKVDNFSEDLPSGISEDRRDWFFAALYTRIQASLPEGTTIPKDGAKVRSGSVTTTQNSQTGMMQSSFIVDLESVQRSYGVYLEWSSDPDNQNYSGYPLVISCLPESQLIYGPFDCIEGDPDSDPGTEGGDSPDEPGTPAPDISLYNKLPINIEYYQGDTYIYYRITGFMKTNAQGQRVVSIKIYDYSGGNLERALDRIRKLGYNPNDYEIEYINESGGLATP